jgi:hypothetical protein
MADRNNSNRQQTIAYHQSPAIAASVYRKIVSDQSLKEALWLKTTKVVTLPRFNKAQRVCFVGGIGTIRDYLPEPGAWIYIIEMEMGPEPEMGRVGSEATILLYEADIHQVIN